MQRRRLGRHVDSASTSSGPTNVGFSCDDHVMRVQDRDPRTAAAPGITFLMPEADQHMATLWAELGPTEQVERFIKDAALMNTRLIALTATRLIAIKGLAGSTVEVALPRPLSVSVAGRPGKWQVTIAARDGRRFSLKSERSEDILALQGADFVGDPGHPPQSKPRSTPPAGGAWMSSRIITSWQDAELVAVEHMQHLGFADAHPTPSGPDGGLDVIATNAAAQVKLHAVPAGSPAVQQLAGAAYTFQHKLFYATAYSADALRWADEAAIALFRLTEFSGVEPLNGAAAQLTKPKTSQPAAARNAGDKYFDEQLAQTISWCQQIIQAAGWETQASNPRKNRGLIEARREAVELAKSALASLDRLNDARLGSFRRASALTDARSKAKKAAKKLGIRLR